MKAKLKFEESGECTACLVGTIDTGFVEQEVTSMKYWDNHKEPYLSEYRIQKIKDKAKELLSKYNYIFGLSTGWQKDEAYKAWCQDVISLSNSFDGTTITQTQVTFPMDPWGEQEILDL